MPWSEPINVHQGLRQGSCTGPFLFLILTQILGSRVTQNDAIKGIKIGEFTIKLNMYADDLWAPMKFDQNSFNAMNDELAQFGMATGLLINYDKTEILRLGSLQYTDRKLVSPMPIKWTNENTRILGIEAHSNIDTASELSYEAVLNKMGKTYKHWENRSLSLIGRVLVHNTLVASKFVYKMLTLKTPKQEFFRRAKKLVLEFLWGKGSRPKI